MNPPAKPGFPSAVESKTKAVDSFAFRAWSNLASDRDYAADVQTFSGKALKRLRDAFPFLFDSRPPTYSESAGNWSARVWESANRGSLVDLTPHHIRRVLGDKDDKGERGRNHRLLETFQSKWGIAVPIVPSDIPYPHHLILGWLESHRKKVFFEDLRRSPSKQIGKAQEAVNIPWLKEGIIRRKEELKKLKIPNPGEIAPILHLALKFQEDVISRRQFVRMMLTRDMGEIEKIEKRIHNNLQKMRTISEDQKSLVDQYKKRLSSIRSDLDSETRGMIDQGTEEFVSLLRSLNNAVRSFQKKIPRFREHLGDFLEELFLLEEAKFPSPAFSDRTEYRQAVEDVGRGLPRKDALYYFFEAAEPYLGRNPERHLVTISKEFFGVSLSQAAVRMRVRRGRLGEHLQK